ncbi:heterokaryon incompatibility protein-domain-containing protein [Cercophora samala]|uniref:Heterokaryon incompatibility protein-domain-containing protein n=1 Tax=Cercophora samala TaxID=330535 RepID=A0AA39YY90_9PEZI|nr:heterokaryon incompatibility protein-domain-containing protein [Cercophora samala]
MASPYTPLEPKPEPHESHLYKIRLLDIEPWTIDQAENIRLRLHPTRLDKAGEYICLSYTWGQPEPTFSVLLNDTEFSVRENLYDALLRLRLPDKPLRIWIDAVCINQDDVKEREYQVSIMGKVYESATDVIAWIGKEKGPEDRLGVDLVGEMLEKITPWWEERKVTLDLTAWIKSITADGVVNGRWLSLLDLISRPWFSRVWIIQEVVMAKQVLVCCGPHQLNWMDLLCCSVFISEMHDWISSVAGRHPDPRREQLEFFSRLCEAAKRILKVGSAFGSKPSYPPASLCKVPVNNIIRESDCRTLYDLIHRFGTFKASDERDRVYALLGVAERFDNIPRRLPTVSYHQDSHLADALLTVIGNDLEAGGRLDFLSAAYGTDGHGVIPSWIPNLRFEHDASRPRQFMPLELGSGGYWADSNCPQIQASVDAKHRTLHVTGWVAGFIDQVSEVHNNNSSTKLIRTLDDPKHLLQTRREWAAMAGVAESDEAYMSIYREVVKDSSREESVKARLRALPNLDLHQRFLGTLMMSGCDTETEAMCFGSFISAELKAQSQGSGSLGLIRMSHTSHGRRFFTCSELGLKHERLKSKNFGLCARNTKRGDKVVMLLGSKTLHIIRDVSFDDNGNTLYQWVGQAYVHNWMQGQLVERMAMDCSPGYMNAEKIRLI